MEDGFPSSVADRRTNALLLTSTSPQLLWAGTEAGFLVCDPAAVSSAAVG